jgi:ferredoxin-thioredoxin reductase catalytic subunit
MENKMTLKIVPNPDQEFLKEITQRVIDNDGYCPCLLYKNPDTKCMCKDFREQTTPGFCHCKRFMKIETEEQKGE